MSGILFRVGLAGHTGILRSIFNKIIILRLFGLNLGFFIQVFSRHIKIFILLRNADD